MRTKSFEQSLRDTEKPEFRLKKALDRRKENKRQMKRTILLLALVGALALTRSAVVLAQNTTSGRATSDDGGQKAAEQNG